MPRGQGILVQDDAGGPRRGPDDVDGVRPAHGPAVHVLVVAGDEQRDRADHVRVLPAGGQRAEHVRHLHCLQPRRQLRHPAGLHHLLLLSGAF